VGLARGITRSIQSLKRGSISRTKQQQTEGFTE
jgi:hypothetical protein